MLKFSLYLFISLLFLSQAHARQLALSFDDGLNPTIDPTAPHINQQILAHLKNKNIQSIIFPSYIKIGDNAGKDLIRQWDKHGHIVGNHSAFHENLNKPEVLAKDYIKSIRINELVFRDLKNYRKIFRYPYLKEGNNIAKRDQVQNWLKQNHYQHGGVSIDASDWFYNQKYLAYLKAGKTSHIKRLKRAYIDHLLDRAEYYDSLALQTLQHSPQHVLLLHTNAINGQFLGEIILALESKGWKIINATDAYTNPLYKNFSSNIPAGESIIWSIAKSQNIENLRYPAEDAPYERENLLKYDLDDHKK